MSMVKSLERLEQRLAVMVAAQETSQAWSSLGEEGPASMKKDKNHGREEADCRAELILINGDCTDPAKDKPSLVLEANGKPDAPDAGNLGLPSLRNKRMSKGDLSKEDLPWPLALAEAQEASMKKDKNHGREEADCRAELILINGDCTDPAKDKPSLVLEANGKPDAPDAGNLGLPSLRNKRMSKGDLSKEDLPWPLALAEAQEVRPRGSAGWESSLRQKPPVRLIFQAGQTRHEMKIKEASSVEGFKELPAPARVRAGAVPRFPHLRGGGMLLRAPARDWEQF
nr:PREDICTED: uncharacterized protein LOC106496795 [Apteryx mantelli mantelli]